MAGYCSRVGVFFLDSVKAQPRMPRLFLSPQIQAASRSQEVQEPLKRVTGVLLSGDGDGWSGQSPSHSFVKYARCLAGPEVLGREHPSAERYSAFPSMRGSSRRHVPLRYPVRLVSKFCTELEKDTSPSLAKTPRLQSAHSLSRDS